MSGRPRHLFGGGKPKPADFALFTRQMATMLRAGVPLVQSFDIVADGFDKPSVAAVVRAVRAEVSGGASFAAALRAHPRCFDALYCSLVDAGEQAGALETMLDQVATYQEKSQSLKARVRKALTYPAAVIIVALVVSGILLIEVVPQFQEIFSGFGADLPPFTLFVIGISEALQDYWPLLCGGAVAAIVGFVAARRRVFGFPPDYRPPRPETAPRWRHSRKIGGRPLCAYPGHDLCRRRTPHRGIEIGSRSHRKYRIPARGYRAA